MSVGVGMGMGVRARRKERKTHLQRSNDVAGTGAEIAYHERPQPIHGVENYHKVFDRDTQRREQERFPAETCVFFNLLFLCLPRACLGKDSVFGITWRKTDVPAPERADQHRRHQLQQEQDLRAPAETTMLLLSSCLMLCVPSLSWQVDDHVHTLMHKR